MSFFIWITIVITTLIVIWFILYAHKVHTARRRAQTLPPGTRVVRANNNTVIYTIPTTQQLSTTYPNLQQNYPVNSIPQNGTSMPPAYDLPPTYDQVVILPPASSETTVTTTTTTQVRS
ncbi:integral component of membrane [Sergentomyia squamirostris]